MTSCFDRSEVTRQNAGFNIEGKIHPIRSLLGPRTLTRDTPIPIPLSGTGIGTDTNTSIRHRYRYLIPIPVPDIGTEYQISVSIPGLSTLLDYLSTLILAQNIH